MAQILQMLGANSRELNTMKKYFVCLALITLLAGCATTVEVSPLTSVKETRNGGFIYSLPKTALAISITLKAEVESTGEKPYSDFAKKLFNIEPISEDKTTLQIGTVSITPTGKRDPSRTYYAHLKKDPFSSRISSFVLNEDGVISSGKLSSQNKTIDYVVTTLEAAAKVASTAAAASFDPNTTNKYNDIPPRVWSAAQRLSTLATDRQLILQNASPATPQLLESVESEMNDIASKFFGSVSQSEGQLAFELEPKHFEGQPALEEISLFTYNDAGQIEFHCSPRGKLPFFVKNVSNLRKGKSVRATIASIPQLTSAELVTVVQGSAKKGIHYCIPGRAKVKVYKGTEVQAELTTPIAQYGPVAYLPASTGSEKTEISVNLDPVTGALLGLNVDAQAFDPKYIERIGNAANTAAGMQ